MGAMNLKGAALSRFSKGKKCLDKDEKGQPAFTGTLLWRGWDVRSGQRETE